MRNRMLILSFLVSLLFILCPVCGQEKHPEKETTTKPPCYLLVGSYTQTGFTVNGIDSGLYVYRMNPSTGALNFVNASPAASNPEYLTIHPNRHYIFAVNENTPGSISAFALDTSTMQLHFINKVSSQGNSPCYISTDPSGSYVFAANYLSGNVASFPIGKDGTLHDAVSVDQHEGNGPDKQRQEGPHAHMILPGPGGTFIYSTDLGTDQVYVYKFDPDKGKLTRTNHTIKTTAGSGPRHIAFHPQHPWMYVINELNGTIEAYRYNQKSGNHTRFQVVSTLPAGNTQFAGCADMHIHPSGKFLYASNRGDVNTIVLFAINPGNGTLTMTGTWPVHGKIPRNFVIDPSGTFLLVANQKSNNIVVFRINQTTGALTDTGMGTIVPSPVCLVFY